MWGSEPYWGLGYDWDPDWLLTDRQKELRSLLIELCEQEMRENAKRSDDELKFPRRNLELLGEHGFLALTVPEEYGGLGQDHVAYSMVCETIARYGCASTAMCYVMHIGAVNAIMLRATPALVDKYIRPLNSGKIGTLSYSDPETGSHFWYPISSGAERVNGGFRYARRLHGPHRRGSRTSTCCRRRARNSRGTTTCLCSSLTPNTRTPSPLCGTRSDCAETSQAAWMCPVSFPPSRSSGRSGTARSRTTSRSTRGSCWDRPRCGTGSRWARSTSPNGTPLARSTSTSGCELPTTPRSRTTWARRSSTRTHAASSRCRSRRRSTAPPTTTKGSCSLARPRVPSSCTGPGR